MDSGNPTTHTYTLAEFETKHGPLADPMRRDAERVTVLYVDGVPTSIVVDIRQGKVKQAGWDAV